MEALLQKPLTDHRSCLVEAKVLEHMATSKPLIAIEKRMLNGLAREPDPGFDEIAMSYSACMAWRDALLLQDRMVASLGFPSWLQYVDIA